MKNTLGKLEAVPLRNIWKKEPDFSAWLAEDDNLQMLGSAVGIDMLCEETEAGVGEFSADILAKEDGGDRKIIIENQYNETDHKHLGQIITYASGSDAKVLIWVVERAREEHQAAIQWLNKYTPLDIAVFLVQIEVFRIGDSAPAPKFTVLESPNDWIKTTRSAGTTITDTNKKQAEWWNAFMDYAMNRDDFHKLFNRVKGQPQNWLNLAMGSSKYHISLTAKTSNRLGAEIYIPNCKEQFSFFESHKQEIEQELGFTMSWQPLPGKQAARIETNTDGDFTDLKNAEKHFSWYCDMAIAFRKIFPKYAKLK